MDAAKAAAHAFVEKQPDSIKIGVVAFSDGGLVTQQPTNVRADVLAAIDRLSPLGRDVARPGHLHVAQRHRRPADRPRRERPGRRPRRGRHRLLRLGAVVLLSDGENTVGSRPAQRGRAGVGRRRAHLPDRHRQPRGHGRRDRRLQRGDGARRGGAHRDRSTSPTGRTSTPRTRASLADIYDSIDLRLTSEAEKTEVTGVVTGISIVLLVIGGGAVAAVVRAGGVAMSFACAAGPPRCCWSCRCCSAPTSGSCAASASRRCASRAWRSSAPRCPGGRAGAGTCPWRLFLASIAGLAVATARPQVSVEVPLGRTSIILALDVSRSMCATDVEPNRLAVAQEAARAFVEDQVAGTRIGIVAFAGFAELVVPPTTDKATLTDGHRQPHHLAGHRDRGGDAEGARRDRRGQPRRAASRLGADGRRPTGDRSQRRGRRPTDEYVPDIIVLLTDGANTRGISPIDAAQQAAERRVRVYTIGFGTTNPTAMVCTREQLGAAVLDDEAASGGGGAPGRGGFRQALVIDEPTLQDGGRHHGRHVLPGRGCGPAAGRLRQPAEPDRAADGRPRDQRGVRHPRRPARRSRHRAVAALEPLPVSR